jgi:hypothetical protein
MPEALYAVFSSLLSDDPGFPSAIQEAWNIIYSEWLPNSGYKFDKNGIDFELYDERCMSEAGKIYDIYPGCEKNKLNIKTRIAVSNKQSQVQYAWTHPILYFCDILHHHFL